MLGLLIGVIPGKAAFNSSVRPLFIEAFIDINFFNPGLPPSGGEEMYTFIRFSSPSINI
jgi:hypothetical protein